MSSITSGLRAFITRESGLESVEFAVMTALIVSTVVVAMGALILAITDLYGGVVDLL